MKNTGTMYRSSEKTPTVFPAFRDLLPPLSQEQRAALEKDILTNGCYAPVIVDQELRIVDGHNRQDICQRHNVPFTMLVFQFEDSLEAKQWALDTQKGRRNLTVWELGQIGLKLRPDVEARAQANMVAGGGDQKSEDARSGSATLPNPILPVDTRKELADAVGIGERTMGKIMKIDEEASAVVKEALDNKELSVNQGYNITRQLQQLPEEQREAAAIDAVEQAKAKAQIRKADAETDEKARISTLFSKAFGRAVLLEATEENVRAWVEFSCMDPSDMEDMIKESRELSETFAAIADILEQKVLPTDWRCVNEPDSFGSEG
ncbi:MAG: hypothetical protein PUC06_05735 [Oscillospiraceae bacterium]|nr:hypothetical protein [Oscillospiraceae bacterium]